MREGGQLADIKSDRQSRSVYEEAQTSGGEVVALETAPQSLHSDAQLMERVAQGEQSAFALLVDRHSARLFKIAYRILSNSDDAEDAVQSVFSKLWQTAPNWKPAGGGLAAWLSRSTVNQAIDQYRKLSRGAKFSPPAQTKDTEGEIADRDPGAEEQIEARELSHLVEFALMELPVRHRTALVLSYFEGYSDPESAQILGIKQKAMESLLVRARRNMRKSLMRLGVSHISEAPSL